jgi:hypothetical protein
MLEHNRTLKILHLGDNKFSDEGIKYLSSALQSNNTLTELWIDNYKNGTIGVNGANYLSQMLRVNHTLALLDLSNRDFNQSYTETRIGDVGVKELCLAMERNNSLTNLYLYGQAIGDVGATYLSKMLKANYVLTNLDLSTNNISDKGACELIAAFNDNYTLSEIRVTGSGGMCPGHDSISSTKIKQIEELALRNQHLIIQRRDQFIRAMLILACDAVNPNSQSLWHQLPNDLMRQIIDLINFNSNGDSIGKSAKQIKKCKQFIFDNAQELHTSLQEAIKTKQDFKIKENIYTHTFCFFPAKSSPVSSVQASNERNGEDNRPYKIQKKYQF